MYKCNKCKITLDDYTAYSYRGVYACEEHFDDVIEMRDFQRNNIIQEEDTKTKVFKGLDLTDSIIGKENRKLLKGRLETSRKESVRLREYERGEK